MKIKIGTYLTRRKAYQPAARRLSPKHHVRQYLPEFVDGDPDDADFATIAELLDIPWVSKWKKSERFEYFDICENWQGEQMLRVKLVGSHAWLLGFLSGDKLVTGLCE